MTHIQCIQDFLSCSPPSSQLFLESVYYLQLNVEGGRFIHSYIHSFIILSCLIQFRVMGHSNLNSSGFLALTYRFLFCSLFLFAKRRIQRVVLTPLGTNAFELMPLQQLRNVHRMDVQNTSRFFFFLPICQAY